MAQLDIDRFIVQLQAQALPPFGQGRCARFVRLALEAGGGLTAGHPVHAKDWGPTLVQIGLRAVAGAMASGYPYQKGDVVVMQATSTSASGHIQAFDGTQWISDFRQAGFWPGPAYRHEQPSFVLYRA